MVLLACLAAIALIQRNKRQYEEKHMDLSNQIILITGGTGSFGRAFIEIMLGEYHPKKVIVYSRDEYKQEEMRSQGCDHPSLHYAIGDVRDRRRLHQMFEGVDIVVHAAALKQVPICEHNPSEAIKTNIQGVEYVIEAALAAGVAKVLALSSDKAVNPTNTYGATKLVAEKLFMQANSRAAQPDTAFSCTRYGNVVGSRGSVMPLFLKQRETGCLTLTDERMTRFWLSLEQGVRFVIRALEMMVGGEIFVPKIPSMRMGDLADAIAPECDRRIMGMRPGEKLHEDLVSCHESLYTLEFDDMYLILPPQSGVRQQDYPAARPMPEGTAFSSATNALWLTAAELRQMLERSSR
jgi:UDP-N-acetylglucosamine 4,6-dehydratase